MYNYVGLPNEKNKLREITNRFWEYGQAARGAFNFKDLVLPVTKKKKDLVLPIPRKKKKQQSKGIQN